MRKTAFSDIYDLFTSIQQDLPIFVLAGCIERKIYICLSRHAVLYRFMSYGELTSDVHCCDIFIIYIIFIIRVLRQMKQSLLILLYFESQ